MSELSHESAEAQVMDTPAPLPLPGAQLRAARQAHGLSLAEVSQALKFGVRQIEALENDDYNNLTGTTFIRGFVRSYARYLRLDEAPLLLALEPQAPLAVAEVRPMENINAEMPEGGSDHSRRAYWLAAVVLMLGGIAWFVWQEKPASEERTQAAAEPVVEAQPQTLTEDAPATPPVPASAAPASSTETAAMVAPSVAASGLTTAPHVPAAPDVAAVPADPNERRLVFSFKDVSWVEVRDASQRVVFSGQSVPNTQQAVRGRPPFQLVVGNAQSVKLRYEDRAIDLQPYTRVDVARLTLDDNTKQ